MVKKASSFAALGGLVLKFVGSQAGMLAVAGALLLCGAASVLAIKELRPKKQQ